MEKNCKNEQHLIYVEKFTVCVNINIYENENTVIS
jgi:hypothetical protein